LVRGRKGTDLDTAMSWLIALGMGMKLLSKLSEKGLAELGSTGTSIRSLIT
jgi:hypothetical protein